MAKPVSLKAAAVRHKNHNKQANTKREQKNRGIIGTGTEGDIAAVTTKLVSVFATRFSPTLDADTLREYLAEKLSNDTVTCRRIESPHSRFASFHITAECNTVDVMFDTKLWPAGIYVRRYYEARGLKPAVSLGGGSQGEPTVLPEDQSATV